MYDVNVSKIESILAHIDEAAIVLDKLVQAGEKEFRTNRVAFYASQRLLHIMIESIADVGNLLIDGFIMRDPGSYQDIIDILWDERVFPKDYGQQLYELSGQRKAFVQDAYKLTTDQLYAWSSSALPEIQQFSKWVREYLKQELGQF